MIRDIQQYQNVPYPLQPVPELQEYVLSNMKNAGDVHEMYEMSLAVEPREREDEKIARWVDFSSLPRIDSLGLLFEINEAVEKEFGPSISSKSKSKSLDLNRFPSVVKSKNSSNHASSASFSGLGSNERNMPLRSDHLQPTKLHSSPLRTIYLDDGSDEPPPLVTPTKEDRSGRWKRLLQELGEMSPDAYVLGSFFLCCHSTLLLHLVFSSSLLWLYSWSLCSLLGRRIC